MSGVEPKGGSKGRGGPAILIRFQDFFRTSSAGGVVLIFCMVLALAWANSPFAHSYHLLHTVELKLHLGSAGTTKSLAHWINDGLMAIFFLLVGLEIKREFLVGELARIRQAALPLAAALGGMLVPALIYFGFNRGGPAAAGWGIPMATDIAFALGVLSLLGNRVPIGLKVFLAALAIIDDLGAILVIAFFYTASLDWAALALAAILVGLLIGLGRLGLRHPVPYLIGGLVLWAAFLHSGVHATIAGVALAFCIPHRAAGKAEPPLQRLERWLHPYVNFLILPLFAIANAGVAINPNAIADLLKPIGLGVGLGLLLGKPVGILLFSWTAVIFRLGELPAGVSWKIMAGCSLLGGIGFTMSIFIAGLGLGEAVFLEQAKLAILAASILSGVAGWMALRLMIRR